MSQIRTNAKKEKMDKKLMKRKKKRKEKNIRNAHSTQIWTPDFVADAFGAHLHHLRRRMYTTPALAHRLAWEGGQGGVRRRRKSGYKACHRPTESNGIDRHWFADGDIDYGKPDPYDVWEQRGGTWRLPRGGVAEKSEVTVTETGVEMTFQPGSLVVLCSYEKKDSQRRKIVRVIEETSGRALIMSKMMSWVPQSWWFFRLYVYE